MRFITFRLSGFVLAAILAVHVAEAIGQEKAMYELTFRSTWSRETHPAGFPAGAHYSRLVGATHRADVEFWNVGGLASPGIELMAETGGVTSLQAEVEQAIAAGTADQYLLGFPLGTTPGELPFSFEVNQDYPLVTLVTMLAPSPDWFSGTHGLSLRSEDGEWLGRVEHPLTVYDAGTDSGATYTAIDEDTNPQEAIRVFNEGPFTASSNIGTFTFLRILDGDFTRDGMRTVEDLDELSAALRRGESNLRFDLNGDEQVTIDDRGYWIESLANTYPGDADLDGEFTSTDLITVFQAGEYEDALAGNSTWSDGDFDGDGDFLSSDLVLAFASGAYEQGPRSATMAVPEPSAVVLALLGTLLVLSRPTRRTSNF